MEVMIKDYANIEYYFGKDFVDGEALLDKLDELLGQPDAEDLLDEIEDLKEQIKDLEQDIEDNYRPIPISDFYG